MKPQAAQHERAASKRQLTAAAQNALSLWHPVLLLGEVRAEYDRMLSQVTEAVRPRDIIEEIWVRDVVDLTWDVLRLRSFKTQLLRSSAQTGIEKLLIPLVGSGEASNLAKGWYKREHAAQEKVHDLLENAGLNMAAVMAETLSKKLDDIERIERMLANSEARRNAVLREVDRHRAALADLLRAASERIEDAEFSDVSDGEKPGLAVT